MRKLLVLKRESKSTHLEPGEGLRSKDKPIVSAASLHDTKVGDVHVALPDHLIAELVTACLLCTTRLCGLRCTAKQRW